MKVIDIVQKLEKLQNIRDNLKKLAKEEDVREYDSDLMESAADAIDDFIQELYRKEIKV